MFWFYIYLFHHMRCLEYNWANSMMVIVSITAHEYDARILDNNLCINIVLKQELNVLGDFTMIDITLFNISITSFSSSVQLEKNSKTNMFPTFGFYSCLFFFVLLLLNYISSHKIYGPSFLHDLPSTNVLFGYF